MDQFGCNLNEGDQGVNMRILLSNETVWFPRTRLLSCSDPDHRSHFHKEGLGVKIGLVIC